MLTLSYTSRVLEQRCRCNIVNVLVILKVREDSNIPDCYTFSSYEHGQLTAKNSSVRCIVAKMRFVR